MSDEPRRQDDIVMGQLLQKVQDSIELANERERAAIKWREAHDLTSNEWRQAIDTRLMPIEAWVANANWSWKLFLGAVALVGVVAKAWTWIRANFK